MKTLKFALLFLIFALASQKILAQCPTLTLIVPINVNNVTPCNGQTILLSTTQLAGHTYQWFLGSNAVPQGPITQSSILVSWTSPGQKAVAVVATNSCGNSSPYQPLGLSVSVIENLDYTFAPISGVTSVCSGEYTYSLNPPTNPLNLISVTWSLTGGGTVTPIIDPSSNVATKARVTWGATPGLYTLTATANNNCGRIKTQNVIVNVSPGTKPTTSLINGISGPDYFCMSPSGIIKNYSVNVQSGITYNWGLSQNSFETIPSSNGTISSSINTAMVTWTSTGGTYLYVIPSTNFCSGEKTQIYTSISSTPIPGVLSSNKSLACGNEQITFSLVGNSVSAVLEVRKYGIGVGGLIPLPSGWTGWQTVINPFNNTANYTLPNNDFSNSVGQITTYEFRSIVQNSNGTNCTAYSNTISIALKSIQSITFNSLTAKTYGDPVFNLSATAGSSLPVAYTSSNTSVATVSASTVTIKGAGSTIIYANQSGNTTYCAAPQVSQTLVVNKAILTTTANNASKTYRANNPAFTLSYLGFKNGETVAVIDSPPTASSVATVSSNAGTYPITLSGGLDNNYTISKVNGTLTINKANLSVTANNTSKIYGSTNPTLSYTYSGFLNGETSSVLDTPPSVTTTATIVSNVGTYPITPSGGLDNNYSFTYNNGALTVTKAQLTATANNNSRMYGNSNPAFTISYTGFLNSDNASVIDTAPVASTSANTSSNVGNYAITIAGGSDNNYNFTFGPSGILTVTKATLSATSSASKTYGASNPSLPITYSGFQNGETASVVDSPPLASTAASVLSNVGAYAINLSGGVDNNYIINLITGTLTINKAPLTARAFDYTRYYGENNPAFSYYYSGLQNGESMYVIDVSPITSTTATTSSSPGTYPITISGGFDNNYYFNYLNGVLNILSLPAPTCSLYISTSGDLCANGRVKLSAVTSGGTPSSYSWSTGESSSSIWVYDGGDYSVTVYFSNGCTESANTYIDYPSGSCIYYRKAAPDPIILKQENLDLAENIKIYPNPANESFVIELPGKAENRLPVSIIDQVGRPVQEASFEKGEYTKTVQTQDLAGGIYIVQIGAGKPGVIRKKVMVVHKN